MASPRTLTQRRSSRSRSRPLRYRPSAPWTRNRESRRASPHAHRAPDRVTLDQQVREATWTTHKAAPKRRAGADGQTREGGIVRLFISRRKSRDFEVILFPRPLPHRWPRRRPVEPRMRECGRRCPPRPHINIIAFGLAPPPRLATLAQSGECDDETRSQRIVHLLAPEPDSQI